jgi:2-methylisocitrate lyase-like PEP mutase family enzyme
MEDLPWRRCSPPPKTTCRTLLASAHCTKFRVMQKEAHIVAKIRAALAARSSPDSMYVIARTDALEVEGMRKALKRGEQHLEAGCDAL